MTQRISTGKTSNLTGGEVLMMKAQPPRRPPLQRLHLLAMFELLHLLQRRAVLLHPLHVTTATLKEPQQLVVHQVAVLHICRDIT